MRMATGSSNTLRSRYTLAAFSPLGSSRHPLNYSVTADVPTNLARTPMSDAPTSWISLGGSPQRREILDAIEMIEAALTAMVHRRDKVPAKLRHEINVRAREPLLYLLLRAGRQNQSPAPQD
jgi:hypothetical protein